MLSKHGKPYDPSNLSADDALEAGIDDLVASNLIGATKAAELVNLANAAGVNVAKRKGSFKNAARAFKTAKLKHRFWPDVYVFDCPIYQRRTKETAMEPVTMWLPLELMEMIARLGLPDVYLSTNNMDIESRRHLESLQQKLRNPNLMGLGLHGDGVPNNYDRTESCLVMSLNLPGVGGKWARMRIPLVVLPSSHVADETMDGICEVLAWSFRHLQVGCHPSHRHDGTPFRSADGRRGKIAGRPTAVQASLVEVRGDWDWYSKIFHFPYHSELDGVCWLCSCKRCEVT